MNQGSVDRSEDTRRYIVRRISDFKTFRQLTAIAAQFSLAPLVISGLLTGFLDQVERSPGSINEWWGLPLVYTLIALLIFCAIYYLIKTATQALSIYNYLYAFFQGTMVAFFLMGGLMVSRFLCIRPSNWNPTELLTSLIFTMFLSGSITMIAWIAGRIWHYTRGIRILYQDGSLCPKCAYSLIGNTSMRCPECGHECTFEELDTTAEEFYRLHRDA